jgi:hypothetical protein
MSNILSVLPEYIGKMLIFKLADHLPRSRCYVCQILGRCQVLSLFDKYIPIVKLRKPFLFLLVGRRDPRRSPAGFRRQVRLACDKIIFEARDFHCFGGPRTVIRNPCLVQPVNCRGDFGRVAKRIPDISGNSQPIGLFC